MSHEESKLKHSKRIQQKQNHIARQYKIAKAHDLINVSKDIKEPHRLAKRTAMTCGDPNCWMCGNPRKFFKERTIQEQKFNQKEKIIHI